MERRLHGIRKEYIIRYIEQFSWLRGVYLGINMDGHELGRFFPCVRGYTLNSLGRGTGCCWYEQRVALRFPVLMSASGAS